MKDSFIFEGKKYISSKRASEISEYASDYIGQLCRANKLDCRMIGRAWFVTEESIHLHKAAISREEAGRSRIDNLRGKAPQISNPVIPTTSFVSEAIATDLKAPLVASNLTSSSTVAVSAVTVNDAVADVRAIVASAPVISPSSNPWTVTDSSIKSPYVYANDDRPLLPTLKKNESVKNVPVNNSTNNVSSNHSVSNLVKVADKKLDIKSPIVVSNELNNKSSVVVEQSTIPVSSPVSKVITKKVSTNPKTNDFTKKIVTYSELARGIILKRVIAPVTIVAILFGLGTGTYISAEKIFSSITPEMTNSAKMATANVSDTLVDIYSSFRGGYKNVVAFFTSPAKLAMNVPKEFGDVTVREVTPNGIVITSSQGSADADDALKQQIRSSFSDNVEISTDESGTAGVITPVFKDTKGKDFIYVMVPVKDKEEVVAEAN